MFFAKNSILISFHLLASLAVSLQARHIRAEAAILHSCTHALVRTFTEGTKVKSQATLEDQTDTHMHIHTYTHTLFLKCCTGSEESGCLKVCQQSSYSLFKLAPFFCSRSFLLCRYPVRCRRFILAPRKMTMLLGTSLVVTQPCKAKKTQQKRCVCLQSIETIAYRL